MKIMLRGFQYLNESSLSAAFGVEPVSLTKSVVTTKPSQECQLFEALSK